MDHYSQLVSDQEARCAAFIAARPENTIRENRKLFFSQPAEKHVSIQIIAGLDVMTYAAV